MSHIIKLPLTKPKAELLREAATLLPTKGFTFTPEGDGGTLAGNGFAGTLRLTDQELEVEITKMPAFLPWPMVEAKIRSFFGG